MSHTRQESPGFSRGEEVNPAAREWLAWSIAAFVFVIPLMILAAGMDFGFGELTLMVFG